MATCGPSGVRAHCISASITKPAISPCSVWRAARRRRLCRLSTADRFSTLAAGKSGAALFAESAHTFAIIFAVETSRDHLFQQFGVAMARVLERFADAGLRRRHRQGGVVRHLLGVLA